jgi:hypothetical protein
MGVVVQAGQRFASIADLQVGEGNQQAAVGTTVALLERGSRTMSAIHKRIYAALKQEFKLLARVSTLSTCRVSIRCSCGQNTIKHLILMTCRYLASC